MEWYEVIVEILKGIIIVIPLVAGLVKYVRQAIREKNWNQLIVLVMNLMAEAEDKFDNGTDRKQWVLAAVQASAKTLNYPIDIEQVGKLIDDLCKMSKKVNAPKE